MNSIGSPSTGFSQVAAIGAAKSTSAAAALQNAPPQADGNEELRERFTQFVGETFFGQMIKAMRTTVGKPAYFHGGRGEEVFQGQLDQTMAEHMTAASAKQFAEPMFELQFPHLAARKPAPANDVATERAAALPDSDTTGELGPLGRLGQLSRR